VLRKLFAYFVLATFPVYSQFGKKHYEQTTETFINNRKMVRFVTNTRKAISLIELNSPAPIKTHILIF